MSCDRIIQTHRYHDGELPAAQRQAHEAHVAGCPDCRQLLAELRGISHLLSGASAEAMPVERFDRIRCRRPPSEERAVLRVAGWFTATAAGILLAAILSWPVGQTALSPQPSIWETASWTMADLSDSPDSELLVVAQWMAEDLSSTNGELR
jgi:anti-sigma factor RsiW